MENFAEQPSLESRLMPIQYRPGLIVSEMVGTFAEVEFVPHALDRMAQRSITTNEILTALRNPTIRGLPADVPHKRIAWKKSKTKTLSVVFDDTDSKKLVVITAYWI